MNRKYFNSLILLASLVLSIQLISANEITSNFDLNKIYFFIVIGVLVIICLAILFFIKIKKRKSISITKVKNSLGLKVCSENGKNIGKIKDVYLEVNQIKVYGWLIQLDKKIAKKIKNKNMLIKHKYVKSINDIMIVDEKVSKYLDKTKDKFLLNEK